MHASVTLLRRVKAINPKHKTISWQITRRKGYQSRHITLTSVLKEHEELLPLDSQMKPGIVIL